jgi:MerR family transcriptional regulator/heat shock protein HspR
MRDEARAFLAQLDRFYNLALADALLAQPGRRVFAAGAEGEVETLRTGTRVRRRTDVVVWRPLGR